MPSNKYTARIAGALTHKPKFEWLVYQFTEPFRENAELLANLYQKFDLDTAQGDQLDAVGARIGASRVISPPIDVKDFFSLDIVGLGLDEGIWHRPFVDASTLVSVLDDASFRFLLRCKVRTNQQDGSVESLNALVDELAERYGIKMWVDDGMDMTAKFIVDEVTVRNLVKGLLTGGYLNVKTSGIRTSWEIINGNN